jgi:tetratricopeptide (TPR) repeat protein
MRLLITLTLGFLLSASIFGQDDKVKELVSQGTDLHDKGKYDEAITKYKAALDIDKNSTLANYELSYTYMTIEKYDDAIKYSKKVIEQNTDHLHPAYVVLGSSLDMKGKSKDAIKAYEEGLTKFPNSNMLNYNLALTSFNLHDYDKAEQAAIKAVLSKPTHGSSHIILGSVMKAKGERVKALLSFYYFLMLEPNSKRSSNILINLKSMLNEGVEQKSGNSINVNIPSSASKDSIFGAAEMMVSLQGASKYTDDNKGKTENEFFVETNRSLFSILGELKKSNSNIWWDLYVTKFYDLVQTNNYEAFSYYISQSSDTPDINNWISKNQDKVQQLREWIKK